MIQMEDQNKTEKQLIKELTELRHRVIELEKEEIERKRMEELLQKERELFFSVIHKAPYGVAMIDQDGKFLYINCEFTKITGFAVEDLHAGKSWFHNAFVFPEYRQEIIKTWKKDVIQRGIEKVFKILCKEGEIKEIEFKPTLLDDGKIIVMLSDITEQKRAEEALRESEERYRSLVETAKDAIFTLSLEGTITSLNLAFETLTGWLRAEWIGKKFSSMVHPDDLPSAMDSFKSILDGDTPPMIELRILTKSGEYRIGEFEVTPKIQNGRVVSISGIARDITERKRSEMEKAALEEQFLQSQKMEAIGLLAGGVAHDFNNLLTVISGHCELSFLGLKERDPLRGNIEEIKRAADRAAILTGQLLAFSRRQILELKVLDLNSILRDIGKMLCRVIGEEIELVTLLEENLGKVKINSGQIEQVILNLAVNAKDAMPDGGKLIIETANVEFEEEYGHSQISMKPGRYVRLSVSDTGTGMPPEVKERIFEPFFTTKERGKGTGLGLSTTYGIVNQSEGYISVYSELGLGTTFKVYLPRVDASAEVLEGKVKEKGPPSGRETVLLVEDEQMVRKLTVQFLRKYGYVVLEAAHGGDALLLCERHRGPVHLMVTDVVMPGINGRELAQRLRSLRPEMKVLYMSGYTDNAILHHGVLEGGEDYVQKPFSMEVLARKVREALDKDSIKSYD